MNTLELRQEVNSNFGSKEKRSIANRAIDFTEEWVNLTAYSSSKYPTQKGRLQRKRECAQYVKNKLYEAREKEFGFIGTLISAVLFQLLVSIIVKFIMDRFFT